MVGSSSSSAGGLPKSACASNTRTFWPPCNSPIRRSCSEASTSRPSSSTAASVFGGIAAFFADDSFEFAQAHAVFVGELVVRLGVERVALFEAPSRGRVAHDHGVDHAKLVEGELVLAAARRISSGASRCLWQARSRR